MGKVGRNEMVGGGEGGETANPGRPEGRGRIRECGGIRLSKRESKGHAAYLRLLARPRPRLQVEKVV